MKMGYLMVSKKKSISHAMGGLENPFPWITICHHSVIVLCFVVRYFVSILVLQSCGWGRQQWLLFFVCLPCVW